MKTTISHLLALVFFAILPACSEKTLQPGEEKVVQIAPGVKMTFCWCPAGEFMMGSAVSEIGRKENEKYVNTVIAKGFWMAKTEVTQAQWMAIMGSNPSRHKGGEFPVEEVSWDQIQDFLIKLNNMIDNTDGENMTLPTEAQWEYACRAGETGPFAGGTIDEVAWYAKNSNGETKPVGMKKPNVWGIHDMHGNVLEWCSDVYDGETYGGGKSMVTRGGMFYDKMEECRAASRAADMQKRGWNGFRIVRISLQ